MRVNCPKCNSERALNGPLPDGGMSYVCPSCSHVFHVGPVSSFSVSPTTKLYVQRAAGKVLGPFALRVVEQMVRSRQLAGDGKLSVDQVQWVSVAEHSHFAPLLVEEFGGVVARTSADGGHADLPVAAAALPVPKGGADLTALPSPKARSASSGLPRPKVSDLSLDELPMARAGEDASWISGGDDSGLGSMDLPSVQSLGLGDLPQVKVPAGSAAPPPLPRGGMSPGGRGLDVPTARRMEAVVADLPAEKGGLPRPQGHLPSPQGHLPRPQGHLPSPQGDFAPVATSPRLGPLPPAVGGGGRVLDRTFGEQGIAGNHRAGTQMLGSMVGGDDALPMMEAGQLPLLGSDDGGNLLMGNDADELLDFGGRAQTPPRRAEPAGGGMDFLGNAPFDPLGDANHLDPLGLGGSGTESDPLGLQVGMGTASSDPLALIGGGAHGDDPLGLMGAEADPLGLGRDSSGGLGGDAGADPLGLGLGGGAPPLRPPPQAPSLSLPEEDDEDDVPLLGGGPSLAKQSAHRASDLSAYADDEEEEVFDLDALQSESPRVSPVESPAERLLRETAPEVFTQPSAPPKRRGWLVAVLVLVLLVVAVAVAFQMGLLGGGGSQAGNEGARASAPVVEADLTAEPLRSDTYQSYTSYLEAASRSVTSAKDPRSRALLLGGISLALTRYPELGPKWEARGLELLTEVAGDEPSKWSSFGQGAWFAYKGNFQSADQHLQVLSHHSDMLYFADLLRGVANYQEALLVSDRSVRRDKLEQAVTFLERAEGDSGTAGASFFLGLALKTSGKPSQAARAFERALAAEPQHVGARLELAHLRTASGAIDEAKEDYVAVLSSPLASPYEQATAHEIAGWHALARNDIDLAVASFTEALGLRPEHTGALRGVTEAFVRSERYQDGINYLTERFSNSPTHPEAQLGMVRCYMGLAQSSPEPDVLYTLADGLLSTGRKANEGDSRFAYYQAILHESRGQLSEAESFFQTAIDIDPEGSVAKIQLARLLSFKGSPEADLKAGELINEVRRGELDAEALTMLGQVFLLKSETEEGIKLLQEAVERNPSWIVAHRLLVEHYVQVRDIGGARRHLESMRRLNAMTPQLRYLSARTHYYEGEYREGIEVMADVIDQVPESAEYRHFLGLLYFARESYPTAKRYFDQTLTLDPRFWDARYYLGRCELEEGNIDDALKILRRVLDERPANGEYHYWLAYALEKAGRQVEALREYTILLQRAGDLDEAGSQFGVVSPLPTFRQALLLRQQGKRSRAEEGLRAALRIEPSFVEAREYLARVLFESNRKAFAARELEEVLRLTEGEMRADLYYALGLCYLELKQYDDAIRALEAARDRGFGEAESTQLMGLIDPADVHRTLGYLYRDRGRRGEAIHELELFLRRSRFVDKTTAREVQFEIARMR